MTHHLEIQFFLFSSTFSAYLTNLEKAWFFPPNEKPQRLIVRQITITNYNGAPKTINFHFSIFCLHGKVNAGAKRQNDLNYVPRMIERQCFQAHFHCLKSFLSSALLMRRSEEIRRHFNKTIGLHQPNE